MFVDTSGSISGVNSYMQRGGREKSGGSLSDVYVTRLKRSPFVIHSEHPPLIGGRKIQANLTGSV